VIQYLQTLQIHHHIYKLIANRALYADHVQDADWLMNDRYISHLMVHHIKVYNKIAQNPLHSNNRFLRIFVMSLKLAFKCWSVHWPF
jgi:hypothetical protein